MRFSRSVCLAIITFSLSQVAFALPIGFGRNQADLIYDETKNQNFLIYHDRRTPNEAKMILSSLNAAKPHLQRWFEVEGTKPQVIITSAATAHASFANLVTNNLEIQTLGQGHRDLFFHEYVHNMMYQRFFNILGPFGAVVQLPWMANWWIEGLAESVTQSQGSDVQASVERISALRNSWPSFNSLHSLYRRNMNQQIGYAVSGGLVSYAFRTGNSKNFAKFHKEYDRYTMPWFMLWSAVPFNGFMPMDDSLESITGLKTGRELYEKYKVDSAQYWQKNLSTPFYMHSKYLNEKPSIFGGLGSVGVVKGDLRTFSNYDGRRSLFHLNFNKDQWAELVLPQPKSFQYDEDALYANAYIPRADYVKSIVKYEDEFLNKTKNVFYVKKTRNAKYKPILERKGLVLDMVESKNKITWIEQDTEKTRLCSFPKSFWLKGQKVPNSAITCPLEKTLPVSISLIGQRSSDKSFHHDKIWLKETIQSIAGDRHMIVEWSLDSASARMFSLAQGGQPVSLAAINDEYWVVVGERDRRTLRNIDTTGECRSVYSMVDFPTRVFALKGNKLALGLTDMNQHTIRAIDPNQMEAKNCYHAAPHASPLLSAIQMKDNPTFAQAFAQADLWRQLPQNEPAEQQATAEKAKGLGKEPRFERVRARPERYRVKPIFAVPWIGADPFGYNFGIMSVPLMEFSQNEELRLTALFGPASSFPNINLALISTRFWPTLQLEGFKSLNYNGIYNVGTEDNPIGSTSYLDETGGRLSATFPINNLNLSLNLGVRGSNVKVFSGPRFREGLLTEFSGGISHYARLGRFGLSTGVQGDWAPEVAGSVFNYNKIYATQSISTPFFLSSGLSFGAEYGQTRGPKRFALRELYRPLKTYVPGEGGGANNFHFEFSEYIKSLERGNLFSAFEGDTQARVKMNWSVPIFRNMDALVWIFYLDRLDLTMFYNYGGAWREDTKSFDDIKRWLVHAHGYNFDMQFEIKGINFNLGIGAGQVISRSGSRPWDYYLSFSFDDIFSLSQG